MVFGDPVLREKAVPVAEVDDSIRQLADDMLDTMRASQGAGLAAEQIGRTERICVADVSSPDGKESEAVKANPGIDMPLVMINPEVLAEEGEQSAEEGCLSFPEIYVTIRRAETVDVSYTNLEGKRETIRAKGLLARAVLHEVDHLNGVLLSDRMSLVQKVAVSGRLKRLKRSRR